MNFASLLNSFKFLQNSELIENLLEKEDLKLEEVLDANEEAIMEVKKGNQKLINFLVPSHLDKLIDYITLEPQDTSNHNQCYKYPFVSNEILNSECHELLNTFCADKTFLNHLFKFLDADLPSNLILAGYFSRTLHSLLMRNSYELLSYLYDVNEYGKALTKHLYSKSICDILERILGCENHKNPAFKSELFEVIELILENVSSTKSPEAAINASTLLANLITKTSEVSCALDIADYLSGDEKIVTLLFDRLFNDEFHVSRGAALIIQALINNILAKDAEEENSIEDDTIPLIDYMVNNFNKFTESLRKKPNMALKCANKVEFIPLGEFRLRIIEILGAMIRLPYENLKEKIAESDSIPIITELFSEYRWNSLLHSAYERLVKNILISSHSKLKDALLIKGDLPTTLIKFSIASNERDFRIGLMGHVTRIGNTLVKHLSGTFISEDWNTFTERYLSLQNEMESRVLGGRSRIMSFDLTDHFMDSNSDKNQDSMFDNIDYNFEKNNAIQEEEIEHEEINEQPQAVSVDEFSSINFWKIKVMQPVEDLE
ncbi:unnamed protein product [Blepharisma stoltei]|uniref:Uncharacterized protein n=1 Tax=Blepharisma stoltei TaxID=1481888 RepID=A0AAU9JWQ0_9CILI|nr:unnamed protein product [Blepharisma stoltei]